jgi:hypothetical protein
MMWVDVDFRVENPHRTSLILYDVMRIVNDFDVIFYWFLIKLTLSFLVIFLVILDHCVSFYVIT